MKDDLKKSLENAGFMHIHEYVDEHIFGDGELKDRLAALHQYQLASESFHLPGGDGFSLSLIHISLVAPWSSGQDTALSRR